MSKKKNIIHRLKIVRGHLDKIIEMVESDRYCIDILIQTKAVQSALRKTDAVLLENHLSTCVIDHIKNGKSDQAIVEVMKVFNQK